MRLGATAAALAHVINDIDAVSVAGRLSPALHQLARGAYFDIVSLVRDSDDEEAKAKIREARIGVMFAVEPSAAYCLTTLLYAWMAKRYEPDSALTKFAVDALDEGGFYPVCNAQLTVPLKPSRIDNVLDAHIEKLKERMKKRSAAPGAPTLPYARPAKIPFAIAKIGEKKPPARLADRLGLVINDLALLLRYAMLSGSGSTPADAVYMPLILSMYNAAYEALVAAGAPTRLLVAMITSKRAVSPIEGLCRLYYFAREAIEDHKLDEPTPIYKEAVEVFEEENKWAGYCHPPKKRLSDIIYETLVTPEVQVR